jgi:hypothetical protein
VHAHLLFLYRLLLRVLAALASTAVLGIDIVVVVVGLRQHPRDGPALVLVAVLLCPHYPRPLVILLERVAVVVFAFLKRGCFRLLPCLRLPLLQQ